MADNEKSWTILAATLLGGVLAFGPAYWTVRTQINAAHRSEVRASRVAALQAYNDACLATVQDDRAEGMFIQDRINALIPAEKLSEKEKASIDARYDKQRDEGDVHWVTMIAKRNFARLVFDVSLPDLEPSLENTEFGWDDIKELKVQEARLEQHGKEQVSRCKNEMKIMGQQLDQ